MIEYLYLPIILLLYTRTWKFNNLIDDHVPRGGYLLNLNEKPEHHSYYDKRRPILATITNVGVFVAVCFAIHHTFGWKSALLFSVFPLNVNGVAWTTGNYYMTTVLFIVTSFYFVQHLGLIGDIAGVIFYVAGLGSTVSAIPFAFLLPFISKELFQYSQKY